MKGDAMDSQITSGLIAAVISGIMSGIGLFFNRKHSKKQFEIEFDKLEKKKDEINKEYESLISDQIDKMAKGKTNEDEIRSDYVKILADTENSYEAKVIDLLYKIKDAGNIGGTND
jgi:hypothetical protein